MRDIEKCTGDMFKVPAVAVAAPALAARLRSMVLADASSWLRASAAAASELRPHPQGNHLAEPIHQPWRRQPALGD